MATDPASPTALRRLANAARRILHLSRQRTHHDSVLPDPPNHPSELVPEMSEAAECLERKIDPLVEKGLLDDGHYSLLNSTVEGWVALWQDDLNAKHRPRQAQLEQTERDLTSAIDRGQRQIQRAEERVAALDNEMSMLSARPKESEPPEEADEPQTTNNGQRRWPVVHRDHRATANEPIEETP